MPDLFSPRPNGTADFVERYRYQTTVLSSLSGKEQRRRLRVHPVGSFEFSFLGRPGSDQQRLQRFAAFAQAGETWVPWWPYAIPLTADVTAGDTLIPWDDGGSIPLRTPSGLWRNVAFWTDPDNWEIGSVYGASGGSMLLNSALTKSWPAGKTRIVPVMSGLANSPVSLEWPNFDILTGRIAWDVSQVGAQNDGYLSDSPDVETFALVPTRSPSIPERLSRRVSLLNPGPGARVAYTEDANAMRIRTYSWVLKSHAEVKVMRDFLDRRWGRAIPFWMPSFQRDMTLTAPVASGESEFSMQAFGYLPLYELGREYRRIYFRSPDGATSFVRDVVGAGASDGIDSFEVDPAIDVDVTPEWKLMFLRYCRLDDDEVEIRWRNGTVATVDLAVRQLPTPPAEIL